MWASARSLGVWGHAPPNAFGRAAASPQTRQMRYWPSSERTTNPSSRRNSLGFGESPAVGGDKSSRKRKPLHLLEITAYAEEFSICGREMKCFFIRFSRGYFPCTQCFFGTSMWGWYHYPRRALHAVETLDARGSRRRIRRFYAAAVLAMCGQNIPSAGTHSTPAPNRAYSGSHAETWRVLRVDGDDVLGSGIIDTIDPFQADQTVAVALAEGHRNAVSP